MDLKLFGSTTRPGERGPPRTRFLRRKRVAFSPSPDSHRRRTRPPRLILRFAIYTACGLAFAGATIILFVRNYATSQAEHSVKYHAQFLAQVALNDQLQPSDFGSSPSATRRAELDRLFTRWVQVDGVLRAVLYTRDGKVAYASDHSLIGKKTADSVHVRESLRGRSVTSRVSSLAPRDKDAESRKVLTAVVPVRFDQRTPVGALVVDQDYAPIARSARDAFLPIAAVLEIVLLALYVSLFPILRRVTERLRRHLDEIEHQALHDNLTALPNRALFRDRVEQALLSAKRKGSSLAVMLVDLNRFKEINDTLGHQSGDCLLQELAKRLRHVLRESDTVARLGGDEFGIVTPDATTDDVIQTAQRVSAALDGPVELEGLSLRIGASIGVSLYPEDADDVDTLMRHADVAMYVAKEAHSDFELYDAKRDSSDATRLSLAGQLRDAIDRRELVLHYQPKVEIGTGQIETVEALVRWQHPKRGLLPPDEFVPLAEQTGLIKPLSAYVLDAALQQCREWADAGIDFRVAVNLDMRNLLDIGFPREVAELLARWNLEPHRLELEITEGTIMADPIRVRQVASQLARMGIWLALDDFGSGYSSLAYLKNLPINELKIDKSFVLRMGHDPSDATIVRSTIDLGRSLGLLVGAEGVETQEALSDLESFGCDFVQGFFTCPPVSAEDLLLRLGGEGSEAQSVSLANVVTLPAKRRSARAASGRDRRLATH